MAAVNRILAPGVVAAWAVKVATVALLLFGATHTDWDRFSGKAMAGRAVAYPLALLVLPILWALRRRRPGTRDARRRRPEPWDTGYPWLQDLLISLPFLIDVAGNAVDAYDAISWFDDLAHFVNWGLLLAALAVTLPLSLPRWTRLGLVVGLGSTTALGWELAEYAAFIRHGKELATAYRDTLGDMTLGTLGAFGAGLLVDAVRVRRARRRAPGWAAYPGAASDPPTPAGRGSAPARRRRRSR